MSVPLESEPAARTSAFSYLLIVPVGLVVLFLLAVIWYVGLPLWQKFLYTAAFLGATYWLYSPKSPRARIAKDIASLVFIWVLVILCAHTLLMFQLGKTTIGGEVITPEARAGSLKVLGVWTLIFLAGAAVATWRLNRSMTRTWRMSALFSRYVHPSVIGAMLDSKEDFFRTERADLTVLFVDLRGFTATSSRLAADQVRDLINIFMGVMIPVAHAWRGTVDKTVGDEIMVLFGAPLRYPDHADQAVKAALALMEAHAKAAQAWRQRGLPVLEMGVGINTGDMVVGNIGALERADYTVIGHHVNLAARLCGQAAASEILISQHTRAHLSEEMKALAPEAASRELSVKGIEGAVRAFVVQRATA